MKKRFISAILAIAMIAVMIPMAAVSVSADGPYKVTYYMFNPDTYDMYPAYTDTVDTDFYTVRDGGEVGVFYDGYQFVGWSDAPKAMDPQYWPYQQYNITGDLDLYPVWKQMAPVQPMFGVVYNGNGFTGGTVPRDLLGYFVGPNEIMVPAAKDPGTMVRDGYIFKGWNTKADGTGITYQPGTVLPYPDPVQDIYLYALWAPAPPDTGITVGVCDPNMTIAGETISIYRLFDATVNADGTSYAYTLATAFNDLPAYLDTAALPSSFKHQGHYAEDIQNLVTDLGLLDPNNARDSGDLYLFSQVLQNYVLDLPDGLSPKTPTDSYIGQSGDRNHKFTNIAVGYYLILGAAVTSTGGSVVNYSAPMLLTNDAPVSVCMKINAPVIHKTEDKMTAAIGDTVNYTVTGTVPNMKGYTDYTYILHDTMSAGLTFDPNSLTVTIGDNTLTETSGDIAVTVNPSPAALGQPTAIKIDFLKFYTDYKDQVGAAITVKYAAALNECAVVYPDANKNKAYLEYTSSPTGETADTPPFETVVYTFKLGIDKYIKGYPSEKLADATFSLLQNNTALKFKQGADANTYIYDPDGPITTFTTDTSGQIVFIGLDVGSYAVREIKAPNGYNKLNADIPAVISLIDSEGGNSVSYWINGAANSTGIMGVENGTGNLLPGTGGIGTAILYTVGLFILFGGGALLIIKKRRNKSKLLQN